MKKLRKDLSHLDDDAYRAYKRRYNAHRQAKYRRHTAKLGIPIASNMGVKARGLLYEFRKLWKNDL